MDAKSANQTYLDPANAGPDFAVQGGYEGTLNGKSKLGAQVVAEGDGKFRMGFVRGGLLGAGRDGKTRIKATAQTIGAKSTIEGDGSTGEISRCVSQPLVVPKKK